MRQPLLCLFLFLFPFFGLSAQTTLSKKKVNFNYENKLFRLALLDLELNFRLEFVYDEEDVADLKVTAYSPRAPLEEALNILLADTDLAFELVPPKTVRLLLRTSSQATTQAAAPNTVEAQQFDISVSGQIRDAASGENLPFTNILVPGTSTGTNSNVDGYFTLFNVPSDTTILEVSYLGYQTTQFRLQPGQDHSALTIVLLPLDQLLQEVTVTASREEQMMKASTGVSQIALNPAQLTAIPSLGERDIFRSLQLLPGISGSNESSSGLYVRGGTPDQNLVLFDGFSVYHVDHLFGFFSAFNSNAIKDVQLYKGGFEARYGGRLSSVINITGKDGNTEEFNIGGGISPLSMNTFLELPFAKGKGSILLTGRRSFRSSLYDNLLNFSDGQDGTGTEENQEEEEETTTSSPFAERAFADAEPISWFYDLNAKATYRTAKDIFSLSLYNGQDRLDNSRDSDQSSFGGGGGLNLNFNFDVVDQSDWGNTGASLKWSRRWNDRFYTNALVSYSNYFSFRDRSTMILLERDTTTTEISDATIEDNDLKDLSFRWDAEWQPNQANKISFGLFASQLDIKYDYIQNDTSIILARDNQGLLGGAYLQSRTTIKDKLILLPGLRTTYYEPTEELYLEPRLQVQYLLSDAFKLKLATGRFYQFANRILREDISQGSRDFWILSDGESVPVGASDHLNFGVSYETDNWLFDVEGYYKTLDNITEYSTRFVRNGLGANSQLNFEENFFNGTGQARGIEFLAQRKSGALTGWISYTLGQVEQEFEAFGSSPFPAAHDVTHELKIVGSYRMGRWTFGGTFVYATGKPYTAPVGAYSIDLLDGSTASYFALSEKNEYRLADYHRLDLSVNYDFSNFFGGNASTGLSFFNFYGNKNIWYKEYEVIDGTIIETDVNLLGFTPSLYFNWRLH